MTSTKHSDLEDGEVLGTTDDDGSVVEIPITKQLTEEPKDEIIDLVSSEQKRNHESSSERVAKKRKNRRIKREQNNNTAKVNASVERLTIR